jgi:hypothetical protein
MRKLHIIRTEISNISSKPIRSSLPPEQVVSGLLQRIIPIKIEWIARVLKVKMDYSDFKMNTKLPDCLKKEC